MLIADELLLSKVNVCRPQSFSGEAANAEASASSESAEL